jgi:hypothetical protein
VHVPLERVPHAVAERTSEHRFAASALPDQRESARPTRIDRARERRKLDLASFQASRARREQTRGNHGRPLVACCSDERTAVDRYMLLPLPQRWSSGFALFVSRTATAFVVAASMLACAPKESSVPATSVQPVTFVKAAPKVGRISIEESSIELRLEGEATAVGRGSSQFRSETIDRERKRDEVLAVFDRIVTKKRISYEKVEKQESRNGSPVAHPPSPLVGRTYVAELKQSVPLFTSPNGGPVSDDERRELARRLTNLGKPDPFLEGIPDGPVYPGRSAPGIGGGLLEIFEQNDQESSHQVRADGRGNAGMDVGKVDVHFAGARDRPQGRCGVFAFALEVQMAGEPRLYMDLEGEFLVRISDSAPIELDIQGPVRVVGTETLEGVNIQLSGAGNVRGSFVITYL